MIEEKSEKTVEEIEQISYEMKQKIKTLCDFDGDSLKGEMIELKKAILDNPAACSLLMPEEIGVLVSSIRKILGVAIATANAPKEKKVSVKKASTKLTPEELSAQLSLISDDDL